MENHHVKQICTVPRPHRPQFKNIHVGNVFDIIFEERQRLYVTSVMLFSFNKPIPNVPLNILRRMDDRLCNSSRQDISIDATIELKLTVYHTISLCQEYNTN